MDTLLKYNLIPQGRVDFLKKSHFGGPGLAMVAGILTGCAGNLRRGPSLDSIPENLGRSSGSLVMGTDRRQMLYDILKPFEMTNPHTSYHIQS